MTPTEALARALDQADACMDWKHGYWEETIANLAALGYEVRPIARISGNPQWANQMDVEATIEQAAEAADREAAGETGTTAPGIAASQVATSAAADPLDVEALTEAFRRVGWMADVGDGADADDLRYQEAVAVAAAYAAAKEGSW